jgi:methylated-DNA-[protein]-cysteine S-methyltransferase
MYYQLISVNKEVIGIVWQSIGGKPQIEHIFLPDTKAKLIAAIKKEFPAIKEEKKISGKIATQLAEFYSGKKIKFDLSLFNLKKLTGFSAKVLKETCRIPHGKVATYSGLATRVGSPRAARAVGAALANNPFPLVIPCHRVLRSDGTLGGFGGGLKMKKELLTNEGVEVNAKGLVVTSCLDANR